MPSINPRIGLYQPYPHTFGGLQAVVLKLARALPDFGFEPIIVSPEEGKFTEAIRSENLPCMISDPGPEWHVYGRGANSFSYLLSPRRIWRLLRYWHELGRDLRYNQIALLHCNDYRGVMLAAPAARLAGIPVIWHMHGFVPSRVANLVASALVHWTVPVSRGMLDYLRVPRWLFGKCEVIYNGLEATQANDLGSRIAWDGSPVVLAIGTLHRRKGFETLIRAFHDVAAKMPQAECWILGEEFGDGSYARDLRNLVEALGLNGNVKFLGHSSDVPRYLSRCSLLAIPSRVEAFGMVALEAMLAGKPVVACRTGGLQEIVVHRQTGSLVEAGDEKEMGRAILSILNDQVLAQRMGLAARARVLEHFTAAKMAASFAAFYSNLLRKAG